MKAGRPRRAAEQRTYQGWRQEPEPGARLPRVSFPSGPGRGFQGSVPLLVPRSGLHKATGAQVELTTVGDLARDGARYGPANPMLDYMTYTLP